MMDVRENYFHDVKIYFHDVKINFQTMKIDFQSLKIVLHRDVRTNVCSLTILVDYLWSYSR